MAVLAGSNKYQTRRVTFSGTDGMIKPISPLLNMYLDLLPGHRFTEPGNLLEEQLKYDPNTGNILEIYQQSTGKTNAKALKG